MQENLPKSLSFSVPRVFEDLFGRKYTVPEKYFYMVLRMLSDRLQSEDGWLFLVDSASEGINRNGFKSYGLSARVCKSARKKLKTDGLIETRYVYGRKGYRTGTEYRLLENRLSRAPKTIHQEIMGRLGDRESALATQNEGKMGVSGGVGDVHISTG